MIEKNRILFMYALLFISLYPLYGERKQANMLKFSGELWNIKSSFTRVGPGPNLFSSRSVNREGEELVIQIEGKKNRWQSGEVYSERLFGYGKFILSFTVDHPLDSNAVFGFFLYNNDIPPHFNEIDFEISRWGNPDALPYNFALQPYERDGHSFSFNSVLSGKFRCVIDWGPGMLNLRLEDDKGGILKSWDYEGEGVPSDTQSRVHFNLWLFRGDPPLGDGALKVRLHSFSFEPF